MNLDLVKQHLYILHDRDDLLLNSYISASKLSIEKYTSNTFDEDNAIHKQALLLLVGNFYSNRESTITGTMISEVPFGVCYLLDLDARVNL